jgi:hypothetical protein
MASVSTVQYTQHFFYTAPVLTFIQFTVLLLALIFLLYTEICTFLTQFFILYSVSLPIHSSSACTQFHFYTHFPLCRSTITHPSHLSCPVVSSFSLCSCLSYTQELLNSSQLHAYSAYSSSTVHSTCFCTWSSSCTQFLVLSFPVHLPLPVHSSAFITRYHL